MTDAVNAATKIEQVLAAYGHAPNAASAESIDGGLINQTYRVRDAAGEPIAVLQKLHPIFGAEVNDDIDVVTAHVAAAGLTTPHLMRTTTGAGWVQLESDVWRMLSWVDGITAHAITDLTQAESAGEHVARFHRAVQSLDYEFVHVRAGVHDTAAHLAKLRAHVAGPIDRATWESEALTLGRDVLAAAANLPDLGSLPLRVCHGDLKISNLLFRSNAPWRAHCLIDLDTMALQTMAYELGDAMRSWCNPSGEDVAEPTVDADILAAAMRGYRRGAPDLLTDAEIASIVPGLATVCIELAARFCVDVFDDSYFGWNAARFSCRRDHNLVRARGQLALARSVTNRDNELTEIVKSTLA